MGSARAGSNPAVVAVSSVVDQYYTVITLLIHFCEHSKMEYDPESGTRLDGKSF